MKTIAAILFAAMLSFANDGNIQYGVRTESVKTEGGYLGTYQFNDTTLTIHFAKRAVSHVRYDFVNNKLYTNGNGVAKDGTVVPAGQGVGNVEYILKQLKYGGYNGFLSLEPHLGSFGGFAKLENGDNKFAEESDAGKFETAYNALKNILERI